MIKDIQDIETKGNLIFKRDLSGGTSNFAGNGISILTTNTQCTVKNFKKSQKITVKIHHGWSGSLYIYKGTLYAVKDNGDIEQYNDWEKMEETEEQSKQNTLKALFGDDPEFLKLVLSSQS